MNLRSKEELENMSLEELEAYSMYLEAVRAELEIMRTHTRAIRDAARDLAATLRRGTPAEQSIPAAQPSLFQRFINFFF